MPGFDTLTPVSQLVVPPLAAPSMNGQSADTKAGANL
jgi:hypothetical protein